MRDYPVPKILYQYLPEPTEAKDTSNILASRRFRLSRVGSMNDPFDVLPIIRKTRDHQQIREAMEAVSIHHGRIEPITARDVADFIARNEELANDPLTHWPRIAESTRLLCLSRKPDGVLLWSHYANYHRGFAVGFNSTVLIEANPPSRFFEVEYGDERVEFHINTAREARASGGNIGMWPLFKRKSVEWRYEEEWRALHHPTDLVDGLYLLYPIEAVHCLILGVLIDKDSEKKLRQACEASGLTGIELKRESLSADTFALEIVNTEWRG